MTAVILYIVGWLVFVLLQVQNSVASKTNGLSGFSGWKIWFSAHWGNLLGRAFFSGVFYAYILQTVSAKLQSAGLTLHANAIAAFAGFAANALLYQIIGLFPWLRVEVQDLAPPSAKPSNGSQPVPPSETRS